ncbi:hypothetical protein M378DRAFT_171751 [Amanita muscaria Koide BX008]|uniref:Uncharacterized protein n=1 Tax=Amanita muscaria (strain Koide BX008) TaxID=946122 RepID=A0A0C2W8D0_AMAMK|nr:hypothetical protein M378DRAFT_171751 [Amanita muscaria Koide BX008]
MPSDFACTSCTHSDKQHFLIRCSCPNDRQQGHPMHGMDSAFHNIWCSPCKKFCYICPHDSSPSQPS